MKRFLTCGVLLAFAGAAWGQNRPASATGELPRVILDRYCVTCHNERAKTAGLMLDKLDPLHVESNTEAWEKVVRKLRAGMMPPQGMPRPDSATYDAVAATLETELDRAAAARPKLPQPGVHRLNRTEYANAMREILGLEIDPVVYLSADDSSFGFDNVVSG